MNLPALWGPRRALAARGRTRSETSAHGLRSLVLRALLGAAAFAAALPVAGADPIVEAAGTRDADPPAPAAHSPGTGRAAPTPAPAAPAHAPATASGDGATHPEDGPPASASLTHPLGAHRTPVPPAPALPRASGAPAPGGAAANDGLAGSESGTNSPGPGDAPPGPVSGAGPAPDTPPRAPGVDPARASTAAPGPAAVTVPELPGAGEPIRPIPDVPEADPERVALGRALFHDPRLSKDNSTACVSCHDLSHGGDDGRRVSVGVEGRTGPINAPTVFNAGLNFAQFWDGRAVTLEQQIDGPVQASAELGSLWPEVIAKLYEHESYPRRFAALYADGITRGNVKDALATYMRSLLTPNSRFDRWLRGEAGALEPLERRGYALFKHYGCVSCHQGANVGGNMFQVFGVLNDYFRRRGDITDADMGRFNVTGNPADRHAFKVPSLRMAALTAPYLHDGSAATLRDAVDAMFAFQLGREAPDADKDAIVAFIKTLAGENRELAP